MKITRKQKEEKELYRHFKRQTSEISRKKTLTLLRKRNLKRKSEFLLTAAENTVIRLNYVKARIDKTQQKRLCVD